MHKIFVIHFQPLELYPPVMNLLRFLSTHNGTNAIIYAVSTTPVERELFQADGITIRRVARWSKQMGALKRGWFYMSFNFSALWLLIRKRPSKILYYETMSAFPAVCYKKIFNRSSSVFVHYHEYTSPAEYQSGSMLNRFFHQLELSIIPSVRWLSHTNPDRLNLFLNDIGGRFPQQTSVLENLPPSAWKGIINKLEHQRSHIINFVYVGAFSLDTLYAKECATLIHQNPQKYAWDIYSDNFEPAAIEWIKRLNASNIHFRGAVKYDDLPATLASYDVGLILYKGHIPNYVYNAPNKLFEYLACGLDVLVPHSMVGCIPYLNQLTFPKVIAINFDALTVSDIDKAIDRTGLEKSTSSYYYETNLSQLTKLLLDA